MIELVDYRCTKDECNYDTGNIGIFPPINPYKYRYSKTGNVPYEIRYKCPKCSTLVERYITEENKTFLRNQLGLWESLNHKDPGDAHENSATENQ